MNITIYQVVSKILYDLGYKNLSSYVLNVDSKEIGYYIRFIRSLIITDKQLKEFIDYFL